MITTRRVGRHPRWLVLVDGVLLGEVRRRRVGEYLPCVRGTDAPRPSLKEAVAHCVVMDARRQR